MIFVELELAVVNAFVVEGAAARVAVRTGPADVVVEGNAKEEGGFLPPNGVLVIRTYSSGRTNLLILSM
jgi:glutamate synthase domain-containing protein 3